VPGQTGVTVRLVSNDLGRLADAYPPELARVIAKHAYDLEALAKGLSPVLTGTLRRSIHTVLSEGGLRAVIGPSVDYGKYVEFGTRRMAARPYMRPAFERTVPRLVVDVKAVLRRAR
jgi:HK97 gp10 family phage protein